MAKKKTSWGKSKIKVPGHSQLVRSTWEAFFWIIYPDYLYEDHRIEYDLNGKSHNYIVDFVDHDRKDLVEIKPAYMLSNSLVQHKIKVGETWAAKNGYTFRVITEHDILLFKKALKRMKLSSRLKKGLDQLRA